MALFRASVIGTEPAGRGLFAVELDQTAFYPTGGGQPHDTGSLAGADVVDVKEAGDGRIVHMVRCGEAPAGEIEGRVDWRRRFDHMQQHTGQHILSRAFVEVAGASTRSFHLGGSSCTIDIDLTEATGDTIREAETLANEIVFRDRPVVIDSVPAENAGRIAQDMDLVRELALKPGDPIRIIRIDDFDETPCGGTHVGRAGEVGCVSIRGWERFKGGTRVTFYCGARVVAAMRDLAGIVDGCVSRLSVRPEEIPQTLDRLREQAGDARRTIRTLSEALAGAEAVALDATARDAGPCRVVVEVFDERDEDELQLLARKITASPGRIALLATVDRDSGKAAFVFARSGDGVTEEIRMGDLISAVCRARGGNGGGGPTLARGGGVPAAEARSAIDEAFEQIADQVGS